MEEIVKKIETYHIINYLLPGIIFGVLFNYLLNINLYDGNTTIAIVEYYFTGMVLNRIGSVIIKPILKNLRIINEFDYLKYIEREREDEKITILNRDGNQYRTFIAVFLVLIFVELYRIIFLRNTNKWLLIISLFVGLLILFILSYRKYIDFIKKRVERK